jgi:catechol 2,3-dioxygenase-like lactoylglutathione lyase family enzyme
MKKDWKVAHLGVIVKDLENASRFAEATGLGKLRILDVKDKGKVIGHMHFLDIGGLSIELFADMPEQMLVSKSLKQTMEGLHHISFKVKDLEKEVKALTAGGAKLLFKKDVENGVTMKRGKIAFLDTTPIGGMLIELEQIDE